MGDDVQITFDDESRVRVLPQEKYQATKQLGEECKNFVTRITGFRDTVSQIVDIIDKEAQKIEVQKLKAIGMRNRVQSELSNRKRKKALLRALINEKLNTLDRVQKQLDSLTQVEAEQLALIEKLSNNEPA